MAPLYYPIYAGTQDSVVDIAELAQQPSQATPTGRHGLRHYLTAPNQRWLRRLATFLLCGLYFAVLPKPPILLPKFLFMLAGLIWFFISSFQASPLTPLATKRKNEDYQAVMDLGAAQMAWLCDPFQPSPVLLIIPIVIIIWGFQKGFVRFRLLLAGTALSAPAVFILRVYWLGLHPALLMFILLIGILLGCIYGTLKNIDLLNKRSRSKANDLEMANHRLQRTGQALQESEARYRSIFENSSAAMCLIDNKMRLSLVNTKFEALTRYNRNELYRQKRLTDFIYRQDLERIKHYHTRRKQMGGLAPDEYECQLVDKYKNIHHVIIRFSIIPWHERITATIIDITSRKMAKMALNRSYQKLRQAAEIIKHSEHRYRNLFENTGTAMILVGKNLRITMANTQFAELTGCAKNDINGNSFLSEFIERKSFNRIKRFQTRQKQKGLPLPTEYECIIIDRQRNKKYVIMKIYSPPNQKYNSIVSFFDITARKQTETALQEAHQKLRILADSDELTQIGNRRRFDEQLNWEWARLRREGLPLSMIMADVDCFKLYNDNYGHQKGDQCLRAIAKAISTQVKRSIDLVARYGGEEFAIILPNTDFSGAIKTAEAINQAVEQLKMPNEASPISDYITISLGVSTMIPKKGEQPDELIRYADNALYEAKGRGRNRTVAKQPDADNPARPLNEFPLQKQSAGNERLNI